MITYYDDIDFNTAITNIRRITLDLENKFSILTREYNEMRITNQENILKINKEISHLDKKMGYISNKNEEAYRRWSSLNKQLKHTKKEDENNLVLESECLEALSKYEFWKNILEQVKAEQSSLELYKKSLNDHEIRVKEYYESVWKEFFENVKMTMERVKNIERDVKNVFYNMTDIKFYKIEKKSLLAEIFSIFFSSNCASGRFDLKEIRNFIKTFNSYLNNIKNDLNAFLKQTKEVENWDDDLRVQVDLLIKDFLKTIDKYYVKNLSAGVSSLEKLSIQYENYERLKGRIEYE